MHSTVHLFIRLAVHVSALNNNLYDCISINHLLIKFDLTTITSTDYRFTLIDNNR